MKTNTTNQLWILVKNRLNYQLGINVMRYEKDNSKKNRKILTTVAIILCLGVFMFYCGGIALGYSLIGMTDLIPSIAMVISSLFTLFFTIFKTNGELFGFHDYDLVMSLPVPVRTIINSRFMILYLWNTLISILVMIPMGGVYAYFAHPSLDFYIMWPIGILLTSLIPTTIAAVFGAIITAIAAKFKYATAISTILSLGLVMLFIVLPMIASSTDSGLGRFVDSNTGNLNAAAFSEIAPMISETLHKVYPPAKLFTNGIVNGMYQSFLLFAVLSISWYILFITILSLKYKELNTALTSRRSNANYKLKTLSQGNMLTALHRKNFWRIMKSTVCSMNLLMGCILSIIMSIAILVVGPEKVLTSKEVTLNKDLINSIVTYALAATLAMSNTAAVSLALEGKNIWLIKSLPIEPKTLYDSYLLTNLIFTVPTSIICSTLLSIALKTNLVATILLFITPIIYSILTAIIGIFFGNRLAFYDWKDETHLVKQSMLSMISLLGGFFFVALCGAIVIPGLIPIPRTMSILILDMLLLGVAVMIYKNESKRPIKE